MAGEQKIRSFVALKTPPGWDDRLRELQGELGNSLREVGKFRWVKPEQLHLTLRFLGHITPEQVEEVKRTLSTVAADISPFQLSYAGLGCFPRPSAPRVLWAGIAMRDQTLPTLHEEISTTTAEIGQPLEKREFRPHLTLARIEDFQRRKADLLEKLFSKHENFIASPWHVTEVLLMRSHLSPPGARYEPLLIKPLGRS